MGRSCTKVHGLSKTSYSRRCWKTLLVCPWNQGLTERGTKGKPSIAEPSMLGWKAKLFLSWGCLPLPRELLRKNTVTPWGLCQPWALQWGTL